MKFPREVLETLINGTHLDHSGQNLYGTCPYCNQDEFGISLNDNHLFRCFRGRNCGETGNIYKLLKHLDRTELLGNKDYYKETDVFSKLEKREFRAVEVLDSTIDIVKPPLGWRRVSTNDYLEGRGFTSEQFEKYEIGLVKLQRVYRDYVVFLIRQRGDLVGFISRNIKSKDEIDSANRIIKERNVGKEKSDRESIILRYRNSLDTDFSKILYGIDEISDTTQYVIIVEGLFDKINLEIISQKFLEDNGIVICCTWGKKISPFQVKLLKDEEVDSVVLMYDPDAVQDSKKYGSMLKTDFKEVRVGFLKDKDPGDLQHEEFLEVLRNLQTPEEFKLNILQRRQF